MKRFTMLIIALCLLLTCGTCQAAEFKLPESLKIIEVEAFAGIDNMGIVRLPDSVERIDGRVFAGSTLERLELPEGNVQIADNALEEAVIGEIFAVPGTPAYDWAVAKGYINPEDLITPESAFEWSQADDGIRIDKYIGEYVYVVMPAEIDEKPVVEIGNCAFMDCKTLETINLPDGLENIHDDAFLNCEKLRIADLPDSVESMGRNVFANCVSLKRFHYPLSLTESGKGILRGCPQITSVEIPEGVEFVSGLPCSEYIQTVTLPSTVKTITNCAFMECKALESINLPDGLEHLHDDVFLNCEKLTIADLPDSVQSMGRNVFANCVSLESFHYPLSLTESGKGILKGCPQITSVEIPEGVEFVSGLPCSDYIRTVTLPSTVKTITNCAFMECKALESINLPDGLMELYDDVFLNCANLPWLYVPVNVTSIGRNVFNGCEKITVESEWSAYVIDYCAEHNTPYFYLSRTGEYELNGAHWPSGKWYKGDDYIFDGYVRSSINVDNVKGSIYTSDGVRVRYTDYNPSETDHLLAGQFTNAMDIGGLDLGSYRFILEATAGDKYELLVETTFDVVPPPLRVRCEGLNIPEGFYGEDEPIPVEGTIISNYPIQILFGAFSDDGNRTSQVYDSTPGGFTYELASAGLDMTTLNGGGYQFLITVSGNDESITVVCTDFTRSGFGLDGTVTYVDTNDIARFVSDANNHSVFYSLGVDFYQRLMDSLSPQDQFKLGMYTFCDKMRSSAIDLMRFALEGDERRSDYLIQLYKKEIASFIRSQGKGIDTWNYTKPDHQKLVDSFFKLNKVDVDAFVPDMGGIAHNEAVKLAKQASKSYQALHDLSDIANDTETLLELAGIFADALEDYSQGLQVLDTIAAKTISGADYDYNYQLAVRELQKEYSDKCVRCMDNLVNYAMKKVVEEGEKEAIKTVIKAIGGGELYLVYTLSKIGWDIFTEKTDFYGDVGKIVTYKAQIDTFYAANRAYQEAFDAIKAGDTDQTTAVRMVNAFQYAKDAAWRSIGTLRSIRYYTAITSDVTLDGIQLKIRKLSCP